MVKKNVRRKMFEGKKRVLPFKNLEIEENEKAIKDEFK